ncbi:MAG: MFS transporter [Nitratireductor sp.]
MTRQSDSEREGAAPSGAARRDPTKKNVLMLCIALGLSNTGASLVMTVTALTGIMLADPNVIYDLPFVGPLPETALATLALGVQFIGTMAATIPASLLMGRIGRRAGFSIGQAIGIAGGSIGVLAIIDGNFWLFVYAGFMIGVHNAFWQYYRFAAADTASEAFKPKAISYVMIGPIFAGIFGPEIAKHSRYLIDGAVFAGSYAAIAALSVAALGILQFLQIPKPTLDERKNSGRPLGEIVRNPTFPVAVFAAMVGYASMSFLMTATPLAMTGYAHPFEDAAFVIQWHVLGMFVPSFFTGHLIKRFGTATIILTGALLFLSAVAINATGVAMLQFLSSLILVGVGWNFMFIGGTTLLTETYRPEEKAKVQALNDFCVFSTVAFASLLSGVLQSLHGWWTVNLSVGVAMTGAILLVAWFKLVVRRRMRRTA